MVPRRVLAAVVFAVCYSLVSCGSDAPRSYEPGEISQVELDSWKSAEILVGSDTFEGEELKCIDHVGADVDPDVLRASQSQTFAEVPADVRDFIAGYFDECLTDEHMKRWFYTDILKQGDLGFSEEHASCLSSSLVEMVHQDGFAAAFDNRSPSIAAELETNRQACGIIGPSVVSTSNP